MKIYIDIVIITNTIITLICIETAARMINTKLSNRRLFLSSFIGGLTSLLIAVPANEYSTAVLITIIKILSYPMIALIAFKFKSIAKLIRNTLILFTENLAYMGIVLVLWEFSDTKLIYIRNYTVYFNISVMQITIAVVATYAALTVIEIIRKAAKSSDNYNAVYTCGNYKLCVRAVADTGNKLCDCFTRTPVVIIYCDDLYYYYGLDSPATLSSGKFRLLPFETINGGGLIPVTYSGELTIIDDNYSYSDLKCCIGIKRSCGKRARAIFNPRILN